MTAVHPVQRAVMHGLQTQFQADVPVARMSLQEFQHFFRDAIGARADNQTDELRMAESFFIKPAQFFDGSISVRGRLKIGEEHLSPVALAKNRDAALYLGPNGSSRQAPIGTEAAVIAIDATPCGHSAIDVGASKAGVDGDPINTSAKAFLQKVAEGPIAPVQGLATGGDLDVLAHISLRF